MGKETVTAPVKRIEILDILRGFALAGILYAHMVFWYTGAALPQEIYFQYNSTASYVAMAIFGALIFGNFFSIFSFLFGLGFYLHFRKRHLKKTYIKTYLWRMLLLFLIGLAHHSIWRGDILAIYAVLGVLLLFFRLLPDKFLLLISLMLIINLPTHIFELFQPPAHNAEVNLPMASEARSYYSLIKIGDLKTVMAGNTRSWPAKIQYQLESGRLLMTLGYFLLGFYAGRRKLFRNIENNLSGFKSWNKVTGKVVLILLAVGLILYLSDFVSLPELKIVPQLQWPVGFLFSIYKACLTVFYITGITLLFRLKAFKNILKPLAVTGRMALTNYLLQTLFGLLIFYRFGMGFFDKTSPALNVLIAFPVFYLLIKFSEIWLKNFRMGPVEWLWRSLSYFRFISNKKRK